MATIFHPDISSNLSAGRGDLTNKSFGGALVIAAGTVLSRLKKAYKLRLQRRIDRQAFTHLLALDEYILRDIGVTRDDVIWATRLPPKVNASRELEKISQHNRSTFW
jgi:uncharacterized protein YjiS (DUF1127 family)